MQSPTQRLGLENSWRCEHKPSKASEASKPLSSVESSVDVTHPPTGQWCISGKRPERSTVTNVLITLIFTWCPHRPFIKLQRFSADADEHCHLSHTVDRPTWHVVSRSLGKPTTGRASHSSLRPSSYNPSRGSFLSSFPPPQLA
jgi:hypothetical protein